MEHLHNNYEILRNSIIKAVYGRNCYNILILIYSFISWLKMYNNGSSIFQLCRDRYKDIGDHC